MVEGIKRKVGRKRLKVKEPHPFPSPCQGEGYLIISFPSPLIRRKVFDNFFPLSLIRRGVSAGRGEVKLLHLPTPHPQPHTIHAISATSHH